jgi:hypothetical protein
MEIAAKRAKRADRLLVTVRGNRDHVKGGADIKARRRRGERWRTFLTYDRASVASVAHLFS